MQLTTKLYCRYQHFFFACRNTNNLKDAIAE